MYKINIAQRLPFTKFLKDLEITSKEFKIKVNEFLELIKREERNKETTVIIPNTEQDINLLRVLYLYQGLYASSSKEEAYINMEMIISIIFDDTKVSGTNPFVKYIQAHALWEVIEILGSTNESCLYKSNSFMKFLSLDKQTIQDNHSRVIDVVHKALLHTYGNLVQDKTFIYAESVKYQLNRVQKLLNKA